MTTLQARFVASHKLPCEKSAMVCFGLRGKLLRYSSHCSRILNPEGLCDHEDACGEGSGKLCYPSQSHPMRVRAVRLL